LHFPGCEKVNIFVSDGSQYNFVSVSEIKMVAKVEQREETGGVRRNEEVGI